MDPDINILTPKSPFQRKTSRFIQVYRTPRSEGFHRQKYSSVLDSPCTTDDDIHPSSPYQKLLTETPPSTYSPKDVPTPFKEIVRNRTEVLDQSKFVISEKKFYSNTTQRKKLLPLFIKSEAITTTKDDRQRPLHDLTLKRKRSKSVDYKRKSKFTKLNNSVRHCIKKPKLNKSQGMAPKSNPITDDSSIAENSEPVMIPPIVFPNENNGMLLSTSFSIIPKRKSTEKQITAKVNRMVRMNLQCGEIRFTKQTSSPKKTTSHRKTTQVKELDDELEVAETDEWITNKVNNILNVLDVDNSGQNNETFMSGNGSEASSNSLIDTAAHLSDAFCVLDVGEGLNDLHSSASGVYAGESNHIVIPPECNNTNVETSQLSDSAMDVTSESAVFSLHDISKGDIENAKSENLPENSTEKLYPLFYKEKCKQNFSTEKKLQKDPTKSPFNRDFFQSNDGLEQLVIDVGQKGLGPSSCPECGFFYMKGDPSEEKMHKMYHGSAKPGVKHTGWKWERVAVKYPDARVIRVCPGDPKTWWTKVEAVLEKANDDLGITYTSKLPKDAHAYMYVGDGYISGCVIAEPIRVAYYMLESDKKEDAIEASEDEPGLGLPKTPSFCSNIPVRGSRCGINRMWTCASERRKGIATKMLDAIRATFVYGHILKKNEIAFSDPTPMGMAFAQKYIGVKNFLVYKLNKD